MWETSVVIGGYWNNTDADFINTEKCPNRNSRLAAFWDVTCHIYVRKGSLLVKYRADMKYDKGKQWRDEHMIRNACYY